nr:MAG TPA: hypothetical protein [Caudoviricetes sp.]
MCGSNCGGTPGVRTLDPLIKSLHIENGEMA